MVSCESVTMARPTVPLTGRLAAYPPFGWRSNPAVPAFSDAGSLILFDGVCVLCSGFARFVAERDRSGRFRFVAAQSGLGQALLRHYDLNPADPETNLLITDGRAYAKLEAVAGVLHHLGWTWRLAANLIVLPPATLRDWLYDRVARNRYALFGRSETCAAPGPGWRARILEADEDRSPR